MSVIYFTDQELKSIYVKLSEIINQDDFSIDIDDKLLYRFIMMIGLCNRFTYHINYIPEDDKIVLDVPNLDAEEYDELSLKKLIEKLDLLEYNCITNSGKCFLDKHDKELLDKIINKLRVRYIDLLEKL